MAENTTQEQSIRMGPLSRTDFKTPQEFADAIAAAAIVSVQAGFVGPTGPEGAPGTSFTLSTETAEIPNGASDFTHSSTLVGKIVQLVNNVDAPPTIGIRAISGAKVYFTGAIPNTNYRLSVSTYTLTNA